jgi:hypothetical protein
MRRRSLSLLILTAVFSSMGASCLSPTLPLPPPVIDSIIDASDGYWTIAGSCIEGALVTVLNETQGQGVVIEDRPPSGRFVIKIKANLCDVGWASQLDGLEGSRQEPFVFKPKSPNDKGVSSSCK